MDQRSLNGLVKTLLSPPPEMKSSKLSSAPTKISCGVSKYTPQDVIKSRQQSSCSEQSKCRTTFLSASTSGSNGLLNVLKPK